jgi:3-oxoacyl-[acyl-carrier protein] reductase
MIQCSEHIVFLEPSMGFATERGSRAGVPNSFPANGKSSFEGRPMSLNLEGKTAIVTGAASGLGRASALALAHSGVSVVVAGLEPEGLEETAAMIRGQGGEATHLEVDISKADEVEALAEAARAAFGGTDVLVNNAGVYPNGAWHEISEEEWDYVFSVNVKGYFLCSKAVRPQMLERGGGSIINISSITFFVGADEFLHYVSSKGAVIGLTRALAKECGPEFIRVNSIAPGAFPTRAYFLPGRDIPKLDREVLDSQAIKRKGKPEDIGNAVLFFASELSSFVTGQTLLVDGGWYLH